MDPLAVSIPDAAELLGVSTNTAAKLVQNGTIPSVRWGGRVLVPVEALRQKINAEALGEQVAS